MPGTLLFLGLLVAQPLHAKPRPAPSLLDRVQVVQIDGSELRAYGRPVEPGYFVAPGTRLEISAGGRAVLDFSGQGIVELRGPATVEVVSRPRPGISVVRGRLLAVLEGLRSPFSIKARIFSIIVTRGADLYVDLMGRDDMYLCACRGTVQVTDEQPSGYRKILTAEDHRGLGYRLTTLDGRVSAIESDHELEGHSDADLDALRSLAAK